MARHRWWLLAAALLFGAAAARAEDVAHLAPFEPTGTSVAEGLAKATAVGKPLFVDVTSASCGFCRLLDEAYAREDVAAALRAFVCVRIDGENGEGRDLVKRRRVDGYPTLLVLDASGTEIDRVAGYLRPAPLVAELGRIARGERTLPALRAVVDANPTDVGAALALAAKLAETQPEEALVRLAALEAALGREVPGETLAELLLTKAIAASTLERTDVARDLLERVVREMPETAAGRKAAVAGILVFLDAPPRRALAFLWQAVERVPEGEVRDYVETHAARLLAEEAEAGLRRRAERAKDDPEELNEVAWTCFERRVLPEESAEWAERAVELSGRKPHVLDTLANLRFRAGATDEAIRLEEEALANARDETSRADFAETLVVFRALRDHRLRLRSVPGTVPNTKAPSGEGPR